MALPPTPPTAVEAAAAEGHRTKPTSFLTKTYQIVDDPAVDDVISWNGDGTAFIVWKPAEFARDLLPKFFKHNNFSSFVRQLNTYGFKKIMADRWEFANDCFKRGERRLLCEIHRRKMNLAVTSPPAVTRSPANSADEQSLSSNSSPGPPPARSTPDLISENERLRKENMKLSHELARMKNLCHNVIHLVSKYGGVPPQTRPPRDLMPARIDEGNSSPRLFGVHIGSKRARDDDEKDQASQVKTEPLDYRRWLLTYPQSDQRVCNS